MASRTRPSSSSSATSSSAFSLPGPLGSVLAWTLSRWNSLPAATSTTIASQENHHHTNANGHQPLHSAAGSTLSLPSSEKESLTSLSQSSHFKTNESSLASSRPSSRHHQHLQSYSSYTPPPLPPVTLQGYSSFTKSHLLTRSLAEEIRQLMPARLQLYDTWNLVYSLEQHGVSLSTLYERCAPLDFKKGGFVLVVQDDADGIFGAFVNEPFKPSGRYYGTGECFLWKAAWLTMKEQVGDSNASRHKEFLLVPEMEEQDRPSTPSSLSSSATLNSRPDETLRFKAFPYSGINDYMIYCDHEFLSVGGGDGKYGLWLDDNLEKGVSSTCPTFGNEQLSDVGGKFDVIGVEVWSIGGLLT